MRQGRYLVTGKREYRGHAHGSIFDARIPAGPAQRAIDRGDIRLLEYVEPRIERDAYTFPGGWLDAVTDTRPARRREASLS